MAERPLRRLRKKERRLVRARVADPDATLEEIGAQAGYVQPRKDAWRALQREPVKVAVRELMNKSEKLQLPTLLKKLEEGLEARETKFFADKGKVRETRDVIDYGIRHRYLDTALEMHGVKDKAEAGVVNIAMIFNGQGSEDERHAVSEALLAARISRGLHPIENRKLTPQEAAQFTKSKER